GDAAILIDPNDQRAFTDAVEAVLTKPELRKQLSEKGASRARSFTWENCADKTVELYHEVLGGARVA
ncbi:MAG TPA: glycosyltransferase family 1 protein, partial [Candidatus Dormibacteraeota bacterium]|nr:glycosyltransferase family 1 protein [Candidatus Dormibacteraeota bacterium]